MSQVAADFQTQAPSAVVAKGGRQGLAQPKAPSSRFDDLLSAIPDAPPEPRARAKADAPERPQPAQGRTQRDNRTERTARDDRPADSDRNGKSDTTVNSAGQDDRTSAAADSAPPKDAAEAKTDTTDPETAATETTAAGTEETGKSDETSTQTADGEIADTTAVTQEAVAALVSQPVAADPVPAAPVAKPTIDGEVVLKPDAAKVEIPKAATQPSNDTAKQQAAMLADQATGLSAEDAEVLSALAAKAQQGLKNADGDMADKKVPNDKAVHAAKLNSDAAVTDRSVQPAQTEVTEAKSTEARSTEAKPVNSDLAKLGTEHQRSQSDGNTKTPAEAAPAAGNTNAPTVKAADSFASHLISPSGHPAHAAAAPAAAGRTAQSTANDRPVAIADVAMEVSAKISSGKNQFDIRLDPEELGRIHVKVNVDRDGNVTTHMVADRRDTLDLLRRDTQGLERALQDAGLKTSDNSLQFSLRDQAQQNRQNQQDGQAGRQLAAEDEMAATLTTTVIARDYGRYSLRPSGVDIRV